jgi:chromate transporter
MPDLALARPPLRVLGGYFLRLGATGFGGPIALVESMRRELVEQRGWFSPEDFSRSLALSQLAPGPLAAQVAVCLGFLHSRLRGATVVIVAFVAPSFLLTLLLGALYVGAGGMPWIATAFYGVGAVVIGIIVLSAVRLARSTAGRDPLLWGIAVMLTAVTAWRAEELIWLFPLAGLVGMVSVRRGTLASVAVVPQLFWYFAKAGAFVFGSGLAIVPFLYAGVVTEHGWLTERQFIDAIAVAMLTPGPVVITAAFIGFLVAGVSGALAATAGVFLPAFLIAVTALPLLNRFAGNPMVKGFVRGVTAAAAGAIAGACAVLGRRAIIDVPTAILAVATLVMMTRTRVAAGLLVLGGAILGLTADALGLVEAAR